MGALLFPVDRAKGEIRWGLVAHTVAMFLSVTIYTAMNFDILSTCYIGNREFPGVDLFVPGPLGYQLFINSGAIITTADTMFTLNVWLADGLLVGSISGCIARASNASPCSSYTVVTSFMR